MMEYILHVTVFVRLHYMAICLLCNIAYIPHSIIFNT
jgi:hypothetical protein